MAGKLQRKQYGYFDVGSRTNWVADITHQRLRPVCLPMGSEAIKRSTGRKSPSPIPSNKDMAIERVFDQQSHNLQLGILCPLHECVCTGCNPGSYRSQQELNPSSGVLCHVAIVGQGTRRATSRLNPRERFVNRLLHLHMAYVVHMAH